MNRYEDAIYCAVTEVPPEINGFVTINAVDADYAGERVDYVHLYLGEDLRFRYEDLEYDSLATDGTSMVLKFDNNELVSVHLSINGTIMENQTMSEDGTSKTESSEKHHAYIVELEKR